MVGNFQCRGVVLIWIPVGQGPTVFAVGADEGFSTSLPPPPAPLNHISFLSLYLLETARCRLKYCVKDMLIPNQLTNQIFIKVILFCMQLLKFYGWLVVLGLTAL